MSSTVKKYGASISVPSAKLPDDLQRYLERFKPGPATAENRKNPGWRARTGFDSLVLIPEDEMEPS